MKSLTIPTPQNSSKRRSKETPSNRSDFKYSNSSKVVEKSQNSAFSDAFEDNSTNRPLDLAISDGNRDENIPENGGKSSNSPLLEQDSSDLLSLEISDEFLNIGEVLKGNRDSGESNAVKTENVEVQIAVDLLLGALDQVKNSGDVNVRSKKIIEDVIKRAIEPLDLLSGERNWFCNRRRREKIFVGLIYLFVCVVSVLVTLHPGVGLEEHFPGGRRW